MLVEEQVHLPCVQAAAALRQDVSVGREQYSAPRKPQILVPQVGTCLICLDVHEYCRESDKVCANRLPNLFFQTDRSPLT